MNRFRRIQTEFGVKALIRTSLLLVGLFGMGLFDYFGFASLRAGLIAAVGLTLGFLFRRKIAGGIEHYGRAVSVGLFIYSITLLLGDLIGLENGTKLAIITATTVIIFDLQFWSLSDPSVINAERDTRGQAISR
jgi:hypothetical protein